MAGTRNKRATLTFIFYEWNKSQIVCTQMIYYWNTIHSFFHSLNWFYRLFYCNYEYKILNITVEVCRSLVVLIYYYFSLSIRENRVFFSLSVSCTLKWLAVSVELVLNWIILWYARSWTLYWKKEEDWHYWHVQQCERVSVQIFIGRYIDELKIWAIKCEMTSIVVAHGI